MTLPQVVGISGKARSGKDSVAKYLTSRLGYVHINFADILREALWELNPIVDYSWDDSVEYSPVRYQDAINELGYENAKDCFPEFRRVMQVLGSNVGRDILGEDIWVNTTFNRMDPTINYVISDVRFPNEAKAVEAKGLLIRLERKGAGLTGEAALHKSETALDSYPFEHVIHNNDSIQALRDAAFNILTTEKS